MRAVRARRRGVRINGAVVIGRHVVFDVAPGAHVVLEDGAVLGDGCRFHVAAGQVRLGAGTVLGERCVITAHAGVTLGAGCELGDAVVLVDVEPETADVERPVRLQGLRAQPIVVHDGARLGAAAAILPGVTIGPGAVVGTRAVVAAGCAPADVPR